MKTKVLAIAAVISLLSAPVIAQEPCVGDLNHDGEVGGLDTILYKADYPRSEYLGTPCPDMCGNPSPCVTPTACEYTFECNEELGQCCCVNIFMPFSGWCMDDVTCESHPLGTQTCE